MWFIADWYPLPQLVAGGLFVVTVIFIIFFIFSFFSLFAIIARCCYKRIDKTLNECTFVVKSPEKEEDEQDTSNPNQ